MARTAKSLRDLPQSDDAWFIGTRKLDITIANDPGEPHLVFVISHDTGGIVAFQLCMGAPEAADVREALTGAMRNPAVPGLKPSRPHVLVCAEPALGRWLAEFVVAEDLDIELGEMALPAEVDAMLREMETTLRGPNPLPPLTEIAGATPDLFAGFFAAAAAFYRAAPWVALNNRQTLAVRHPAEKDYRFIVVMGQGGIEYGLSVFGRWDDVVRLFDEADSPLERMAADGTHSFTYESKRDMPPGDVEVIQRHKWPVAGAKAYPLAFVVNRRGAVSRPTAEDLRWYEAALRAIPLFVREHLQSDGHGDYRSVTTTINVPTYAGEVAVAVKYPGGILPLGELSPDRDDDFDEPGDMPVFDRRAMEGLMAGLPGMPSRQRRGKAGKLDEAQDLMYRAWEETNPAKRIALAHDALAVSADCADAYVLLAEEEAPTVDKALEYYRAGAAAGERALGKRFFKQNAGHFWLMLETRPYMRARAGVANALWQLQRYDEAIGEYRELLRLNPGDNQGLRYLLLNLFMQLHREDDADALLKAYEDEGSAIWLYTRALREFMRSGDSAKAVAALKEALNENAHVPSYLTGAKRVPARLPAYIGFGDENEAIAYATDNLNYWRRTPGAVEWLKAHAGRRVRRPVKRRRK